VAVFIGPEGGIDEKEIEAAAEAGAKMITLGRRILRTETAAISTLAILMFMFETP
jgi:16S rRNA (uracil1498-N3)-methyltransferase